MRRSILATIATTLTTIPAFAHGGHIADIGHRHSHFEVVAGLVIIAIAATFSFRKQFSS